MRFPVLSEEELNKPICDPGKYWFTVIEASETKSLKTLKDMLKLALLIDTPKGKIIVYDYLLFTPESSWKIAQFCKSINRYDLYKTGNIECLDIKNLSGQCEITLEINPKNERQYPKVKTYLTTTKEETITKKDFDEDSLNDDLPF